jgi:hypothetical protein
VATVDPVRGTVTLSPPQDGESDLAAAEAMRAFDGLRDVQGLLHWRQARGDTDPRAGVSLVAGLASRLAEGSASADDFSLARRTVASSLPPAEKKRLAQEERRVFDEAASSAERGLSDDLDSAREADSALALDRILARAQPRWDGLRSLADILGRKADIRTAAALWQELSRVAGQRRAGLAAADGDPLAAAAAVAGASVPLRAVLDESFYRRFLAENHLEERIADISADASLNLRRKSARIRALFLDGRVDSGSGLGQDILGRLPQAGTYAVSGAYEEFPQVSRGEVLGKIREAWAAGFDPGPLGARKRTSADGPLAGPEAAMTIAALVPAEVSGTVFSRSPVSGRGETILVSAAKPGGDAAHEYLLDRKTGRVVRTEPRGASDRLLQAEDLARLARAARCLDDHDGRGAQIEFCKAAGRLYLLGARAIPGIDEEPAGAAPFTITPPAPAAVEPVQALRR